MSINVSLRNKLLGSFSILILLTVIIGIIGLTSMTSIIHENEIKSFTNNSLVDSKDANIQILRFMTYKSESYMDEVNAELKNVIDQASLALNLMKDDAAKELAAQLIDSAKEAKDESMTFLELSREIADAETAVKNSINNINTRINILYTQGHGSDRTKEAAHLKDLKESLDQSEVGFQSYQDAKDAPVLNELKTNWRSQWKSMQASAEAIHMLYKNQNPLPENVKELSSALAEYDRTFQDYVTVHQDKLTTQNTLIQDFSQIMTEAQAVLKEVDVSIADLSHFSKSLVIILTIICLGLSLMISILLTKSILNQLGGEPQEIASLTKQIAEGDLGVEFSKKRKRGIYLSMEKMTEELKSIVGNINTGSIQVAEGSEYIASSAQMISSGTNEQAANIEEISSSIEELTSNIQQNADNAHNSFSLTKKIVDDVSNGLSAVAQASDSIKLIAQKISIIEEIARQTNLLALNAAIEAARAGIAGKGFAVVASEVRKLAESSGIAAKEITALSKDGVSKAIDAQERIEQTLPSIKLNSERIEEISSASMEQSKGIDQINKSIYVLDSVIQKNATATEELASMSEELSGQANSMRESIRVFKLSAEPKNISRQSSLPPEEGPDENSEHLLA